MDTAEFDYSYPEDLVAKEPARPTRVAFCEAGRQPIEYTMQDLLEHFHPGDLLVINETKVVPARVFTQSGLEILFLESLGGQGVEWNVLFAARDLKVGETLELPGGVNATLEQKGLPQKLRVSRALERSYFYEHGELALPPYIQEARGERHNRPNESEWYQPRFAEKPGSVASPTASLHFTLDHLKALQGRGVAVERLTLHVGAGTFLPVKAAKLEDHRMHAEYVEIPVELVERIQDVKARGGRVWALGTTVARALESQAQGLLPRDGAFFRGETRLFIHPPYKFRATDALLTNFHQPRSTLICLVAAFAGLERVRDTYAWAIQQRFRLFSYGDLTVWTQ